MKNALIIFAKNAILGKVKTRLAKDLDDASTLNFYQDLMKHTSKQCINIDADIHLFYSDQMVENDVWNDTKIQKHIQFQSPDLGIRMLAAFQKIFHLQYKNVIIIGTDCPYITSTIINKSFSLLIDNQIVIGPSKDGGFYLLGTKDINLLDFSNITWSTETVLFQFLKNLKSKNTSVKLLETLEDIDDIAGYNRYENYLKAMNNNKL